MFTEVYELMMQWLVVSDFTDQVKLRPNPADNFGEACVYFRAASFGTLKVPIAGSTTGSPVREKS